MPEDRATPDSPTEPPLLTREDRRMDNAPAEEVPDAQAVPDPPSPFSFGMRALLALMVVAGAQFALMSYLGPLFGLLTGVALCVLAMAVLLVASIFMGLRPGSGLLDRMDQLAIRLVFGILILIFGTLIAGGGQILYVVLEDARFHWRMQDELGFTYEQDHVWDGQDHHRVLAVTTVSAGEPMSRAGVQAGDVIFLDHSTPEDFLRKIDELRGQSIDINIASYNSGGGVQSIGPRRAVALDVPP